MTQRQTFSIVPNQLAMPRYLICRKVLVQNGVVIGLMGLPNAKPTLKCEPIKSLSIASR
jgi:hypothetical protein